MFEFVVHVRGILAVVGDVHARDIYAFLRIANVKLDSVLSLKKIIFFSFFKYKLSTLTVSTEIIAERMWLVRFVSI